jgi:hypothetical protein
LSDTACTTTTESETFITLRVDHANDDLKLLTPHIRDTLNKRWLLDTSNLDTLLVLDGMDLRVQPTWSDLKREDSLLVQSRDGPVTLEWLEEAQALELIAWSTSAWIHEGGDTGQESLTLLLELWKNETNDVM